MLNRAGRRAAIRDNGRIKIVVNEKSIDTSKSGFGKSKYLKRLRELAQINCKRHSYKVGEERFTTCRKCGKSK